MTEAKQEIAQGLSGLRAFLFAVKRAARPVIKRQINTLPGIEGAIERELIEAADAAIDWVYDKVEAWTKS